LAFLGKDLREEHLKRENTAYSRFDSWVTVIRLRTFAFWEGEAPAEPRREVKLRLGGSLALPAESYS
jgi:hypothetical protein